MLKLGLIAVGYEFKINYRLQALFKHFQQLKILTTAKC